MKGDPSRIRSTRICFFLTLAVLVAGLVPFPVGWATARSLLEDARSPEMNRADREKNAGGYYQGLIGADGPAGAPAELVQRLLGKPVDWRLPAAGVSRILDGDFLMFELRPNVDQSIFGEPFTTNAYGMRDRPYTLAKPKGTFRIAVLGSSIDMGWGVGTEGTYVNLFENWLNAHAAKRGSSRRFEVLNFAVAAYSPMQRLEAFHRKAARFDPDLLLYSATMLDIRLLEIHLCDMLQCRVDLRYDYLRRAVAGAGITAGDLRLDAKDKLQYKDAVKAKLRPYYWSIYDTTMATLNSDCHAKGIPLACVIIPRVGKADAPEARAVMDARLRQILSRHADALFDLSDTFDTIDPGKVEVAAWDDHPNALGHHRLFRALAAELVANPLYDTLFPASDQSVPDAATARSTPRLEAPGSQP